jgi:preprotein translocase subunit SecG
VIYLLYTVHVIVSLFLILVVLLQQGKGADLSMFGGGATQTAFGARGATQLIHKLTVGSFIAFILTTLGIGIFQGRANSLMEDEAAVEAPAAATGEAAPVTAPAEVAPVAEPVVVEPVAAEPVAEPVAGEVAPAAEPPAGEPVPAPTP